VTHRTSRGTPRDRRAPRRTSRRAAAGRRSLVAAAALVAAAVAVPVAWATGVVGAPDDRVSAAQVAPAARALTAAAPVGDRSEVLARTQAAALLVAARASAAASAASSAPVSASASASASSSAPASAPATSTGTGTTSAGATSAGATSAGATSAGATSPPTAPADGAPAPSAAAAGKGGPLAGARFWVDPDSDARRELARGGDPALARIADAPGALWLGDWVPTDQVRARTAAVVDRAAASGSVPVLVLYAVPGRDCGGYSSGGLASASAYASWVRAVAAGVGDRRAVVVLEPDALAQVDCLSGGARAERSAMLRDAVGVLAGTAAVTYLDAGNSGWVDAGTMAQRLRDAGVAQARGFALNTSNFKRTADEEAYGERLSAALGGSHYVVDTSRNGNGPAQGADSWCNPAGRALGVPATTATSGAHADAYLWVKRVGESDGQCGRGEPAAGTWWSSYAVGLAQRAR